MDVRLKLKSLVMITAISLLFGCEKNNGEIMWEKTVMSPDGHWKAIANDLQWGGPGGAYAAAIVYLKRIDSSDKPVEVLVLSHQYSPTINIKIKWDTSTHLTITYSTGRSDEHVSIDYFLKRYADVGIEEHRIDSH